MQNHRYFLKLKNEHLLKNHEKETNKRKHKKLKNY